ncbi:hypothetical protein [Nakamurella endophytica]|uniref:hypothetical protein n=1 Tax=Nakamurella endophytica TaxID=1748367 RepID=UPI00166B3D2B|nr:hypothetical protein [Nakamurella endophytica]
MAMRQRLGYIYAAWIGIFVFSVAPVALGLVPGWWLLLYSAATLIGLVAQFGYILLSFRQRGRVLLDKQVDGFWERNRDGLLIGFLSCLLAGLIVLLLTPIII